MGFGTAYRLTKNGGDNGVALWGWLFLMSLVALIPGLGIYLWTKYLDDTVDTAASVPTSPPKWLTDERQKSRDVRTKSGEKRSKQSSWRDNIY